MPLPGGKDTMAHGEALSYSTSVGAGGSAKKAEGLIPGQGTYLGCRFDPWSGSIREATD